LGLATLDTIAIVLLAVLIAIIWGFTRGKAGSALQFLSAGRSLSTGAFVATLVSTWYGGILGVGESVSYYGVGTLLLLGVPYYFFGLIYAFFIAGKVRSEAQISIPERFEARFGRGPSLSAALLIFALALPAAHVLMLGVMLNSLFGIPMPIGMSMSAILVGVFLFRSGLLADVRLGMVAFALMFLGFGVAALNLTSKFPLLTEIRTLSLAQQTFTGGLGILPITSFFILGAWTLVDPGFHQRVSSAASPAVAKRGIVLSVMCWFLFDLLSITCAIYALKPAANANVSTPLGIYPALASASMPPGIRGLFLVGILGTLLSACSGYALVAGGTLGRDLIAKLQGLSEEKSKSTVQWAVLSSCVVAIPVAMLAGNSVITLWYGWAGAVVGALLIPFIMSYKSNHTPHPKRLSFSIIIPFLISVIWMVTAIRTGNKDMMVKLGSAEIGLGTLVPALILSSIFLGIDRILGRSK
jgi:solute:Na+ symporter, SSS family